MARSATLCTLLILSLASLVFSQQVDLDDLLKKDLSDLMDVKVISASKSIEKISEVAATVKVITAKQIRERGYFTLDDLLADLPGFQFRNIQGFNSYVFQRGLPSQNNLINVLIDGLLINELNSGGFYSGGQYNLANVERVEIIYGPYSSLYGTNAISGIINIITKRAKDHRGFDASFSAGTFNTWSADLGYGYYNDETRAGYRFAAMVKSSDKADLGGAEGDYNWGDNPDTYEDDYAASLAVVYKDLRFSIETQKKISTQTTQFRTNGTNLRDTGSRWDISFVNSQLEYTYSISNRSSLYGRLYYRNATVEDDTVSIVTDEGQIGYYRPNNSHGLEILWRYVGDRWKIVNGIVYEEESLASRFSVTMSNSPAATPPRPPKPEMLSSTLYSAFSQLNVHLTESVDFIAGARLDESTVYDQVLTPRVGIIKNWDTFDVKFMYSEAFRAPKPWDYTFGLGNDDLMPESMQSLELSTTWQRSEHSQFHLSVYRNELDDLFVNENVGSETRWVNKGKVETFGVEAEHRYESDGFDFYCSYTFTLSEDENGEQIPEIAKHSANAGITFPVVENTALNLRANYLGERENPLPYNDAGDTTIDDALLFHSSLSYQLSQRAQFYLVVKNIFDVEYYHTSNRPVSRYRQPQRSLLAGLRFNF